MQTSLVLPHKRYCCVLSPVNENLLLSLLMAVTLLLLLPPAITVYLCLPKKLLIALAANIMTIVRFVLLTPAINIFACQEILIIDAASNNIKIFYVAREQYYAWETRHDKVAAADAKIVLPPAPTANNFICNHCSNRCQSRSTAASH